jgi:hypothetical protein
VVAEEERWLGFCVFDVRKRVAPLGRNLEGQETDCDFARAANHPPSYRVGRRTGMPDAKFTNSVT